MLKNIDWIRMALEDGCEFQWVENEKRISKKRADYSMPTLGGLKLIDT